MSHESVCVAQSCPKLQKTSISNALQLGQTAFTNFISKHRNAKKKTKSETHKANMTLNIGSSFSSGVLHVSDSRHSASGREKAAPHKINKSLWTHCAQPCLTNPYYSVTSNHIHRLEPAAPAVPHSQHLLHSTHFLSYFI